ncbi:MAG TPA: CHAT domain-containing protein [Pirellulales bacterium]|nr:CHAT domain-containing protein [Pirellulales bacterium]
MSALVCRSLSSRVARLARRAVLSLAVWGGLCAVAPAQGLQAPQPGYFLAFPAFFDGDYVATSATMAGFLQGAIKNPAAGGFWIDAICYETMRGECNYHMGNHAAAYQCYDHALRLLLRFNNWMLSVQFPPVVTPAPPQQLTPIPWYVTQRKTVIGGYPPTMNIMQGNINNNNAVINGGIVQQAVLVPLYAQEIVRCSCLAIRRWRELLGPASPHSQLTLDLVSTLSGRPALPNHWSEAWIDVQLGLAYAAAGKDAQARKILEKAELASGAFDHPFTGTVHLELGRLDFEAGNYQQAQQHFLEASWAAANYKDIGVVEEALRYGALTHTLTNSNEPYAPLAAATAWAASQGLVQLQASLLLSAAENASLMNQPEVAAGLLNQVTVLTAHCDLPRCKLGARMNHLKSVASYQLGRVDDGDFALAAAMTFQSLGSLWLYHIALVDTLWAGADKDLSDRTAVDLYNVLLRDPTPHDWLVDPLESLSVLSIPHLRSYENWFDAALARKNKEHERALEIADMARRHRFLTTLDEGGRLLNLRWLLEAPRQALDETALLQRQTILTRYPAYDERSREAKRLRSELRKLPLVPDEDDKETADKQAQMLSALATVSAQQEVLLKQISVRREAGNLVFPPLRTFKQTQESLADGQSLLAFFATSHDIWGFLITKDKYNSPWKITLKKNFMGQVAGLLRGWGNWEQNKELKLDELTSGKWKTSAQAIMSALVSTSKSDFTRTVDELVIVPDGLLWYIPFEALPASQGPKAEPLLNKVRVRYAPTVGLALGDTRRRRTDGNMAVALGHLYPRDEVGVVDAGFDSILRAMPEAVGLRGRLPAPGALFGSLVDRLIVLNEISPSATGYDWMPLPADPKSPASPLAQWFSLPFSGPEQVMLPGFRTPAERALKGGGDGSDLFLSICGLMANGARTVLISRWRTGGQASIDLVREFAQELPHTTASDAWQRSVQLVSDSQVNVAAEPRLKLTLKDAPPKADQPFFWAGFLLADTGALPMSDEEEEAAEQVLVAKPADDKPVGEKPVAEKPAEKAAEMKPGDKKADNQPAEPADKVAAKEPANAGVDPPADAAANAAADPPPKQPKAKRVRPPASERKKQDKQKRSAA